MAVKIEAFLDLEEAITDKVMQEFMKTNAKIIRRVAVALDRGDIAEAEDLIREIAVEPALKRSRKTFKTLGASAILFGVSRLRDDVSASKSMSTEETKRILDQSVDTSMKMTSKVIEQSMLRVFDRVVQEYERRAQKAEKVRPFVSFAQDAVSETARGSARLASSLHTSRLGVYGFTAEAQVLGITSYMVNEALDTRTCAVCRTMNGRVFEVEHAASAIKQLITVDDPDTLKSLQPWPKQDAESVQSLKNMSDAELINANWHIPPYHALCRGTLDRTTRAAPSIETTPPLQPAPPKPPPDVVPGTIADEAGNTVPILGRDKKRWTNDWFDEFDEAKTFNNVKVRKALSRLDAPGQVTGSGRSGAHYNPNTKSIHLSGLDNNPKDAVSRAIMRHETGHYIDDKILDIKKIRRDPVGNANHMSSSGGKGTLAMTRDESSIWKEAQDYFEGAKKRHPELGSMRGQSKMEIERARKLDMDALKRELGATADDSVDDFFMEFEELLDGDDLIGKLWNDIDFDDIDDALRLAVGKRYGDRTIIADMNLSQHPSGTHINDLLGAITENKFGFGHSASYYNTRAGWGRQSEAFANVIDALDYKEGTWTRDVLQELTPNFAKFVDESLDELINMDSLF